MCKFIVILLHLISVQIVFSMPNLILDRKLLDIQSLDLLPSFIRHAETEKHQSVESVLTNQNARVFSTRHHHARRSLLSEISHDLKNFETFRIPRNTVDKVAPEIEISNYEDVSKFFGKGSWYVNKS